MTGIKTRLLTQLRNVVVCDADAPDAVVDAAEARMRACIAGSRAKRFDAFRPEHTGQYAMFLYFVSNEAGRRGHSVLADGVYALNKALHAVDWFHEIALPERFHCEHPVGSVLGRAAYGEAFFFMQGCTVGGSGDAYPTIGSGVSLCAHASVLGRAVVGDRAILSAGALVLNQPVPEDVIVFGRSPELTFKPVSLATRAAFSFFS
jgi:serine O-acetyltransferase